MNKEKHITVSEEYFNEIYFNHNEYITNSPRDVRVLVNIQSFSNIGSQETNLNLNIIGAEKELKEIIEQELQLIGVSIENSNILEKDIFEKNKELSRLRLKLYNIPNWIVRIFN